MTRAAPQAGFFIAPLLILLLLVGVAPFFTALFGSFQHDYYGERSWAGLENYRYLFADRGFLYSISVTALWAVLNSLLSVVLGFTAACILSKKGRFSLLFYGLLLVPWGIPIYIAAPLFRALIHGSGGRSLLSRLTGLQINLLLNPAGSFLSALWVSLWLTVPLTAFVILGSIRKMPQDTLEAAKMDGASFSEIVLSLFLPAVSDSLVVMGVLNFIKGIKEFTLLYLFTAGGPPLVSGITERSILGATTTTGIYLYDLFHGQDDFGLVSAYSVILSAGILIVMTAWFVLKTKGQEEGERPEKGSGSRLLLWVKRNTLGAPQRTLVLLAALGHLLLGGWSGFLWTGAYLLTALKFPRLLKPIFILEIVFVLISIALKGFFAGFNPALVLAALPVFSGLRIQRFPAGGFKRGLFSAGSGMVSTAFLASSVLVFYLLIWMSFSKISACYVDRFIPRFFTDKNYIKIITEEGILRYFFNTLVVASVTALLIPLFTFPAAVWLSGKRSSFVYGFFSFIQILGLMGGMHSLVPLYSIFRLLGLLDTYIPLVAVYLNQSLVFGLFTIKAYLDSLPESLSEAARLEGMSSWDYMLRILVPLAKPVIFTSMMVAFLAAWNGFMAPLLFINDDSRYTISVKLHSFVGSVASGNPRWNLFASASILNCMVIGILFYFFRKPISTTRLSEYQE